MKKIFYILLLLLQCTWLHAQLSGVRVAKNPAISQLPVSAIAYTFEDSEGYMWYGTVDGICRDDGYNVHVFRSDFRTPDLMDINSVLCIVEAKDGRIWFGTQKGVYILDKQTYGIQKIGIKDLQEKPVGLMAARKNGDVWIACDNSLYELDVRGNLRQLHRMSSFITTLYENRQGDFFYSTWNGEFYRKDAKGKEVMLHKHMSVKSMCEDRHTGCYWLLTGGSAVWYYNPKAKTAAAQFQLQQVFGNMTGALFREVLQDPKYHYLWLLTTDHISALKPLGNGKLEQVNTDGLFSPEKKILTHIYQSRDGNIWVSAFDHYSFIINFKGSAVRSYSYQPLLQATGFHPTIVTLCKDDGGAFWYYQESYGLFLYDPQQGGLPIDYRMCPAVASLPLYTIPYLVKSHQHNAVWVMTPGTMVMKLRREGSQMFLEKQIDLSKVSKTSGACEVIFEDSKQNLWIGTMNGVFMYSAQTHRAVCISEKIGDVSDFTQSADGYIWCTVRNKGICRISPSGAWKLYSHQKDFLTLDVTTDGTLWASTGEGQLLAFSTANPTEYKDYTLQAGLNGDMVDHVKVDRFNHLWIVTPQTIREFNPKNGAVRVYTTQDEDIEQHRFLPRAVFRDPQSGDMYFGGIPGMISFKTSLGLESIPKDVRPRITDVKVMGKSIWLDPQRKKTFTSIDIDPDEQNITIEFSSLDFRNHGRICYAYRLKGVDKDWVYLPVGKNAAIYNKVGKGDYTFEVKATDENGLWSKHVTTFEIHRLPAWWETWWAYTLYLLLFIAALWQIIKRYKERVAERNDQIIEENVTASKKEYLDNVSKELASPLTEINAIASLMQEGQKAGSGDKQMEKNLGIIQSNVNRLREKMQEEMTSQLDIVKIDERFIAKATKIVEEHLGSDKLDVVFLASELGMSRSTFSRKLKAVKSQTPLEFIRGIKMQHAAEMLKQKTATIQDVMFAVGYNDHKSFAQVFRDTYGVSPSEYQKNNRL